MSYNNDSITYLNNSLKKVDITFSLSDTIDSRFISSFNLYSVNSNDVLTQTNRIGKVNGLDNIMVVDILFENLKDIYIKNIEIDLPYDSYYGTTNYFVKKYNGSYSSLSNEVIDYIDYYNEIIDSTVNRHIVFNITSSLDGFVNNNYKFAIKNALNNSFYLDLLFNKPITITIYYYDYDYLYDLVQGKRAIKHYTSCVLNDLSVNVRNGSYNLVSHIDTINSELDPFDIYLVYSINPLHSEFNTHFPLNWKLNIQEYLINKTTFYYYIDDNFNIHRFVKPINNVSNVYYDESGTGLILLINSTYDVIIDDVGNEKRFLKSGLLSIIKYKHKNNYVNITLNYDANNKLISINHSKLNKTYNINYYSNYININTISVDSNLYFDSSNRITSITGLSNTYYYYDSNSLINRIVDANNNEINLTFSTGIITKIEESVNKNNLNSLINKDEFSYKIGKTIINSNDINYAYVFDSELLFKESYEIIDEESDDGIIILNEYCNDLYKTYTINNREEYIKYLFGGNTSYQFTNLSLNQENVLYSDTFTNNQTKLKDGNEYILEIKLTINDSRKKKERINNINRYLKVELLETNTITPISEIDIDINLTKEIIISSLFKVDHNINSSKLKITSRNMGGSINILSAKIFDKFTKCVLLSNIVSNKSYVVNNYTMYEFNKPINLEYNMGSLVTGDVGFNDLDYLIKNYIANTQEFNVFYNNKRNLIYGIDNFRIYFTSTNYYDISSSLEIGLFIDNGREINITRNKYAYNNILNSYSYTKRRYIDSYGDIEYSDWFTKHINTSNYLISYIEDDYINTYYTYNSYGLNETKEIKSYDNSLRKVSGISYSTNNTKIEAESMWITEMEDFNTSYTYNNVNQVTRIDASDNSCEVYTYDNKKHLTTISQTVDNVLNKNIICFNNDLINYYSNNYTNFNYLYDKYNKVGSVKINSGDFLEFLNTININGNNNQAIIKYNDNKKKVIETDKYGRVLTISLKDSNNSPLNTSYFIYDYNTGGDYSNIVDPNDVSLVKNSRSLLRKKIEYDYEDNELDYYILEDKYYYYNSNGYISNIVSNNRRINETFKEDYFYELSGKIQKIIFSHYVPVNHDYYMDRIIENYYDNNASSNRLVNTRLYLDGYDNELLEQVILYDGLSRVNKIQTYVNDYQEDKTILYSIEEESNVTNDRIMGIENNYGVNYYYTYYSNGLIESEIKEINQTPIMQKYYKYDKLNRVVREDNSSINKTITYNYDSNGNITSKSVYNYTRNDVLTNPISIDTFTYNSSYNDKLTQINGNNIGYDLCGNITSINNKTFIYGCNNRLIRYNVSNSKYYLYSYNTIGLRNRKIEIDNINHTKVIHDYIYDNSNNLIEERINYYEYDCLVNEKIIEFLYTSLGLIGFRINNQIYVYSFTLNGEIDYIYSYSNSSLTRVSEYKYDAFGNVTIINYNNSNIGNVNPIRYKGYYYDDETNLYYLNSRYYDSNIGRFISPDDVSYLDPSILNGLNLYSYCNNNPVMYSDPDGYSWDWNKFLTGVGMVATAVGAIALSVTTFGAGIPLAMSIVAGVTLGAGVLTGINGVATMIEAGTDYNFVRDGLFNDVLGLSDSAYNVYAGITEGVAAVGSMILGFYHTTGQYKAAKASQQYLGKGYTKARKNRWVSADGYRQVRWDTTHHMYKGKPSPVHFNWYEYQYPIAPGVRNKLVSDVHVWLKWFSYYM